MAIGSSHELVDVLARRGLVDTRKCRNSESSFKMHFSFLTLEVLLFSQESKQVSPLGFGYLREEVSHQQLQMAGETWTYKIKFSDFDKFSELDLFRMRLHSKNKQALLLVFIVTAALFESLWQPLIVIVAVPLALIGVFLIFWATDANFDRSAYIGLVLMIGIVVNNSILLVDNMNRLRRAGLPLREAAAKGAEQRLRPVLITSSAALAGLLPMIWGGETSGLWYSLALATIGGLSASTLLVLFIIPSLFTLSRKHLPRC